MSYKCKVAKCSCKRSAFTARTYDCCSALTLDDLSCNDPTKSFLTVEEWRREPGSTVGTLVNTARLSSCDTLRFWTNGSIDLGLVDGSANVEIETNNLIGATGPPSGPPPGPDRPAIHYNALTGEVTWWVPFDTGSTGPGQWTTIAAGGSTGTQGAPGMTGARGVTGAMGMGAQGLTGNRGTTGANGVTGSRGTTGANGITGSRGTTGTNGLTGSRGTTGANGVTGSRGTTGANGVTGSRGTTGANGVT